MYAVHHYCCFVAFALAASQLASQLDCQAATEKKQPLQTGSAALEHKLSQITERAGYRLLSHSPCADSPDSCTRIRVKTWDDESLIYEIIETPCNEKDENCLGGFTVRNYFTEPSDHESLQGWSGTGSLKVRAVSQAPARDSVAFRGAYKANPAVLVSGRIEVPDGREKRCGRWESSRSDSAIVSLGKNLVGNVVADNCESETAVFAENAGAQLINPEGGWSRYTDSLVVNLESVLSIPTAVWVVHPQRGFSREKVSLEAEFKFGNEVLAQSRCGIRLEPVMIQDRSDVLTTGDEPLDCASIDPVLKQVGYDANRMNVYVVSDLLDNASAGVACKAESDNVIIVRNSGRDQHALVHEFGHWLGLEDTGSRQTPLVNSDNIMHKPGGRQNMFTAGQCYRMNFSADSYINVRGIRKGATKNCNNKQEADRQCPGLKMEF